MKVERKRSIFLLAIVAFMLMPFYPVTTFAADSDFVIEGGVLTQYNNYKAEHVIIPDGVTKIWGFDPGDGIYGAFRGHDEIKSITMPDSVTVIGEGAFRFCRNLEKIELSDNLVLIDDGAFDGCESLERLTLPDSVTKLGAAAFYGCTSLELIIPDDLTDVQENTFTWCKSVQRKSESSAPKSNAFQPKPNPSLKPFKTAKSPSSWAVSGVNKAIAQNIIPLDWGNHYQSNINREKFCNLMIKLVETKLDKSKEELLSAKGLNLTNSFSDTNNQNVIAAQKLGIVSGKKINIFDPLGSITREEAAVMLTNTAKLLNMNISAASNNFKDKDKISVWAQDAVNFVSQNKIMNGTNAGFEPKKNYTNEQAFITAQQLYSFDEPNVITQKLQSPSGYISFGGGSYWGDYSSSPMTYRIDGANSTELLFQDYSNGNTSLVIETYDANLNFVKKIVLPTEMSDILGCFHRGEDGFNYIAYGYSNNNEDPNKEVIRIVKYDQTWNRINALSIKADASEYGVKNPFSYSKADMDDYGDALVLHLARIMFKSSDGLNHQANMTVKINTRDMSLLSDNIEPYFAGHSFNQLVKFDGDKLICVDLGDAYPRAIQLNGDCYLRFMEMPGEFGDNYTGVALGILEASDKAYLLSLNTTNLISEIEYQKYQRNAVCVILPKNTLTDQNIQLTNFYDSEYTAGIPYISKLSSDKLFVVWEEFHVGQYFDTKYAILDGLGKVIKNPTSIYANRICSEVQLVSKNGQVSWFFSESGTATFYTLDLSRYL